MDPSKLLFAFRKVSPQKNWVNCWNFLIFLLLVDGDQLLKHDHHHGYALSNLKEFFTVILTSV